MLQSAMDCSESLVAEPHLEGTAQRQKDRSHLKHAFSLGYARWDGLKMEGRVCGTVKSQVLTFGNYQP